MPRSVLLAPVLLLAAPALASARQATPVATPSASAPRVLARGASLTGANGLGFDRDGRLHVASAFGRAIAILDPETGARLDTLGADRGVEGPDDLAFGPDGSLYWTALTTGEVGRLSPGGTVTRQFVAPGVNPITFSDDGRLFVAAIFLADALFEIDPDLTAPPRLVGEGLGPLNGMDWGPDGLLYAPVFSRGRLVRIDVDAPTAAVETVAEGFGFPSAVKFDPQGRLHAVDLARGEVVRLDPATGTKEVVAGLAPGLDNLTFDAEGRLYVSNNDDGAVVEVRPDGSARTVSPGGLIAPGGVAVLPRPDGGETL